MNALVVLLARLSTGLFLILWAFAVQQNSHGAVDLVTTLSQGFFVDPNYRMALVYGAGTIGVLVILGLLRMLAYPLQVLALAASTAAVWKSLADPLGLYLFAPSETNIFFFPMFGLFVASLVPLSLWETDAIAVDRIFLRSRDGDGGRSEKASQGMRGMTMATPAAAAAIAQAAHAAPAHADASSHAPAHDDHHGHSEAASHGHADAHAHEEHATHDDHGHAAAHGHDDHGHDDHGHGDQGHGDHGHDTHGHDDHGHGNGHAAHH